MAKNLICSTLNSRAVFDIEFQEHLKAKEIRKYLIAFIIFPPTFSDGAVSGTISMFSHFWLLHCLVKVHSVTHLA